MTSTQTLPLHYENFGTGHPLIVLHGLFGSLVNWKPLSREWSEFFHVFAVDQRNHGRSPHSSTFNYAAMAADLNAFMQAHGLISTYLLGHSLGGKTAMQFALTYPEMVDKLVVVDMSPQASRPRHHSILAALQGLDLAAARSRRELDAQLAQHIFDREARQFLLMNITSDESGQLRWRMNLDALAQSYDEVNKAVDSQDTYEKPALFIRGEKSDYIPDEDLDTIKTLFPLSRVVTVTGAGHWLHAEAPQEFSRLVLDFLNE
ncbi:MAG TPA: alpha/beta fold hydrolase [Abditibacteriaceae bacterium]|jgi:pimeloyl-ACP methyl ester carboxylesterase